MKQDEADKELGRILREALIKGINFQAALELDVALDIVGVGSVVARIRVGRLDGDKHI